MKIQKLVIGAVGFLLIVGMIKFKIYLIFTTVNVQILVDGETSSEVIESVDSDNIYKFLEPGVYDYPEYVEAREKAISEGDSSDDHVNRFGLAETYGRIKLMENIFETDPFESPYFRSSVMGNCRRKILREAPLTETEIEELIPYQAVRWEKFISDISVHFFEPDYLEKL